jgi:hypothetical protein
MVAIGHAGPDVPVTMPVERDRSGAGQGPRVAPSEELARCTDAELVLKINELLDDIRANNVEWLRLDAPELLGRGARLRQQARELIDEFDRRHPPSSERLRG